MRQRPFQQPRSGVRSYPLARGSPSVDDADIAAGQNQSGLSGRRLLYQTPPTSMESLATINTKKGSDLEFYEDLVSDPVLVLGVDISHLSRKWQFIVCAVGVFGFSLLYGYLQELLSVTLCSRKLGLFLAMMQFSGYTILAYILRNFVYEKKKAYKSSRPSTSPLPKVPILMYLGLSLLRAVDLAFTNLAMQYLNYPAKTLMKSSRVVFTMLFGVIISGKVYKTVDYLIVLAMVLGLAIFMHADATSSAVFHHMGVIMLTISLTCDGAISNMSETIMSKFGVGQDEFIFRMYSIALVAITVAAAAKGDLKEGIIWMSQPGTYDQLSLPVEERQWSVASKMAIMALFSSMGFFGSSCSAAITKNFGALTMSITSTARKATTLFLSFFLFNNVCTVEHLFGILLFISALTTKSLRRGKKRKDDLRGIDIGRGSDDDDLQSRIQDELQLDYKRSRSSLTTSRENSLHSLSGTPDGSSHLRQRSVGSPDDAPKSAGSNMGVHIV